MTDKDNTQQETESGAPNEVAIEAKLPLTAIDIESQKDMESGRYHSLRSLHKWFAARPTPAVRLSILASAYAGEIDSDHLLRLMQIGPKSMDSDIAEYVEKKFTESKWNKTIDEHYGYPNPNTQSPTNAELSNLHQEIRESWGGDLPTIMDPTAGRGIIPFESMRYGFPTKANELNPVAYLILKTGLNYAPSVGSLETELQEWGEEINSEVKNNLSEYFPTEHPEHEILNSAMTYIITCDACGGEIPLVGKWWVNKTSNGGHAIKPHYAEGKVTYEHVKVQDTSSDYDPNDGPVLRGDATCPHCGVVTEQEDVREIIGNGDFEYSIYAVNYQSASGDWEYRAGSEVDKKGMKKASKRIESDFELLDFFAEPYPGGYTDRVKNYGVEEWKDIFTPRQLVTHFEFLQAFDKFKPKIKEKYNTEKANAILTLLTFAASRCINFNSRLTKWRDSRGYGGEMFADNNYVLKKMAVDNNLSAARRGYINHLEHVIESYEELTSYSSGFEPADLAATDAAELTSQWEEGSVDIAVVDPPYYSSIMYAELSDVFYLLQKDYLSDMFPDLFNSKFANKEDEAVANPSRFDELADSDQSKKELADDFYENKMQEIFSEVYQLLGSNGVMTVMFTHRDMDAWDTLTTALIEAGFTITSTHPIKTEMGDRIGVRDKASADSSILLVGRKRAKDSTDTTLWEDVSSEFYSVAQQEAKDILDSGYSISKTDTAIATYGPTLQRFAEEYPVVNKKGESIRPREALTEARKAVTSVIAERFLNTEGIDQLDSLTRWYVLAWLIYENDTIPFDEANQLGVASGVNIEDVKRPTKLWRGGKEVELQKPEDRVQDIVMLRSDSVDNPSSRKYPVDPTNTRFTYTIDTIHAAIHIYEREGPESAWDWLTERNLKSNSRFEVAVTALLEVLPKDESMYEVLVDLISGSTGEYLDIDVNHIDMSGVDKQTSIDDHTE